MKNIIYLTIASLFVAINGMAQTVDKIYVNDFSIKSSEQQVIDVQLENPINEFCAFQFDMLFPEGVSIVLNEEGMLDANLNEGRKKSNHTLSAEKIADGCYRFVCFSMTNASFNGDTGAIVHIKVEVVNSLVTGTIKTGYISNVILTKADGNDVKPEVTAFNMIVTEPISKYALIYMVDGMEYKKYELDFGSNITPEIIPTKVGYTFSGWSEIPSIMPNHELVINGTFIPNKYQITYMLDENVFQVDSVLYGEELLTPEAPVKEWFSFDGWTNVPETMPADDLTLTGSYTLLLEMGDVNGDYRLSVVDVSILTNKILRKENDIFVEVTADLNGDGRISIVDITMATNKIIEE